MANYYLMDEMTMTAFNDKCQEIHDAHKAEEAEIRTTIKQKCERKNLDSIYFYGAYESAMKSVDNDKKAEMNELLEMLYKIVGTKKAEVCAEACRLCDELGITESKVVRPVFDKSLHCHLVDQCWYICKENGVWFQKMSEDCKAKHEVKF